MYKVKRFSPFTLMEVLIAFMLVTMSLLPLIYPYTYMYKSSQNFVKEIDLDRQAGLVFANIQERLSTGSLPYTKDKAPIESLNLPYKGFYSMKQKRKKKTSEDEKSKYLITITISFDSINYSYDTIYEGTLPKEEGQKEC